jgi:hypothetical protein
MAALFRNSCPDTPGMMLSTPDTNSMRLIDGHSNTDSVHSRIIRVSTDG